MTPLFIEATYERVKQRRNANTAKTAASREILSFVFHTWNRVLAEAGQPAPDVA